jgi:hypothetical protein
MANLQIVLTITAILEQRETTIKTCQEQTTEFKASQEEIKAGLE